MSKIGVARSQVRPCLVSELDRQTLWENMDIIDCFATDHGMQQLYLMFYKCVYNQAWTHN